MLKSSKWYFFFPVGKCIYKPILKYFWTLLISNSVNCSLMSLIAVVRAHRGTSPDACWSGNKLTGADTRAGWLSELPWGFRKSPINIYFGGASYINSICFWAFWRIWLCSSSKAAWGCWGRKGEVTPLPWVLIATALHCFRDWRL